MMQFHIIAIDGRYKIGLLWQCLLTVRRINARLRATLRIGRGLGQEALASPSQVAFLVDRTCKWTVIERMIDYVVSASLTPKKASAVWGEPDGAATVHGTGKSSMYTIHNSDERPARQAWREFSFVGTYGKVYIINCRHYNTARAECKEWRRRQFPLL